MGNMRRLLKAECSLLAATVLLSPVMLLCGCNDKPEQTATETETEITETSATETEFVPSPFRRVLLWLCTIRRLKMMP